jgi:hypothetical protein
MSASSITLKIGFAAVGVPAVGFVVGFLLQTVIPGCRCDSGAGCHGCGPFGGLIAFLVFGGFVGALFSLIFVLPVAVLLSIALKLLGSRVDHSRQAAQFSATEPLERDGDSLPTELPGSLGRCPNCSATISLRAKECSFCKALFGDAAAWKVEPL